MSIANYNGVGGGTVYYAYFPRFHPSDFRFEHWMAWRMTGRRLCRPGTVLRRERSIVGVAGLAGDPAYPYHEPPLPPVSLGRSGGHGPGVK